MITCNNFRISEADDQLVNDSLNVLAAVYTRVPDDEKERFKIELQEFAANIDLNP